MKYLKIKSRLTTTNTNTYSSVEEWIQDHGPCGTNHTNVSAGRLTWESPTSVIRELIYKDAETRAKHQTARTDDRQYITETLETWGARRR